MKRSELRSIGPDTRVIEQDSLKEGVIEQRKSAFFGMKDEQLISTIDSWILESKSLHDKFKVKQTRNEQYFLGHQLNRSRLSRTQARIVINKVWQNLETVLPRATRRLPAPTVSLPNEEDEGKRIDNLTYANNLENVLVSLAKSLNITGKAKEFLRFSQLFYLGVLKFGYDKKGGIWVENVRPQRILVPPRMSDEYVGEYHEDTVKELKVKFPKKVEKLNNLIQSNKKINEGTRVGYYEFTTKEFKVWKLQNIVLRKVKNPHWDSSGKKNHWKTPQLDYVFSDLWQMGMSLYSQTTLVDQVITLQDALNKRKRQISDNADHANGSTVVFGESGITKKEASAMESNRGRPNSVTYTKGGNPGGFQHIQGQLLQPYVAEDMQQTIREIDNIFGTHSATRGEKTPGEETFGGRQLLQGADQERIGELTLMLERVIEQLYNAVAQMIRVHFKKSEYVSFIGEDGTSVQLQIDKNLIREGVDISVKEGAALVKDKSVLSAEAIQLWQNNAIDPITLYERLGDPHPLRTAERLWMWQQAPAELFKKAQSDIDKATKSDKQKEVLTAIAQAEIENRAFVGGQTLIPAYQGANEQHIATHQDLFTTDQFRQLPQEIRNAAAAHLEEELGIVKGKLDERIANGDKGPKPEDLLKIS